MSFLLFSVLPRSHSGSFHLFMSGLHSIFKQRDWDDFCFLSCCAASFVTAQLEEQRQWRGKQSHSHHLSRDITVVRGGVPRTATSCLWPVLFRFRKLSTSHQGTDKFSHSCSILCYNFFSITCYDTNGLWKNQFKSWQQVRWSFWVWFLAFLELCLYTMKLIDFKWIIQFVSSVNRVG